MEEDDNQFNIAYQHCNGFVIFKVRSVEMLYITFLHSVMYNLGLYIEEIVPENLYFQWPSITKMQHMYQKFLKKDNGYHDY